MVQSDVAVYPRRGGYYVLLSAYFISSVGDWLYKISLPLLIFELTGSAFDMAVSFGLTFLPFLLVSLFGGIIADRFDRRLVLIACDSMSFIGLCAIAWVAATTGSIPVLYVLIFIAASMTPIHHPSFQAFIPEVVQDEALPRANSLVSGSENIIMIAAPLLGGALVAFLGPVQTILINAVTFVVSAVLISLIKKKPLTIGNTGPRIKTSIRSTIAEGFRYAWSHPVLKYGSLLFVGSNFAINIFQANFIFYLVDNLETPTKIVGIVLSIVGVGAITGSLIAPILIDRFKSGHIIVASTIAAGLSTYALLAVDDPLWVGGTWAVTMMFGAINVVTYFTLRQRAVPLDMLGRAVAITRLISFSSIPVAAVFGGYLLERTSIGLIIFLCASIRLGVGIGAYFTPLASYEEESVSATAGD